MKKSELKLFCLSVFTILFSVFSTSAKENENLVHNESSNMISEEVPLNITGMASYLPAIPWITAIEVVTESNDCSTAKIEGATAVNREAYSKLTTKIAAATMLIKECKVWRKVWQFSWSAGPKRVWKEVTVACPQTRGPGTTVPPHRV